MTLVDKDSFATLDKVRARAVLIDTEMNAAKKLERSSIGCIFQGCNVSFDATGAANNWAAGYYQRGPSWVRLFWKRSGKWRNELISIHFLD
jgi:hypothetical protein